MKRLAHLTPILACSFLVACDAPTAPPRLASSGPALDRTAVPNAACFPVRFRSASEWFLDPLTVAGTLAGDVAGSFVVTFDPTTVKLVGKTSRFEGTATITVTGGVLPVPLPLTFGATFHQKNLEHDSKASPAHIYEQLVTYRATSGVRSANLQMQGYYDATTGAVSHDWWGVICP